MWKFIMNQVIIRIVLFILVICAVLFLNYWHGKQFHRCTECETNKIMLPYVPELPDNCVDVLENTIRTTGSVLDPKRNFGNAQGRKINYTQLPECIKKFYDTEEFANIASKAVGERLSLAPMTEKYRIFARLYEDDDDFLDWHYDNNFTKGIRYTLVIPVLVDDCNTAEFKIKDRKTEAEKIIQVPLGMGVLYNGTDVYHKITQQTKGCRRMVVIIPFYSNYEKGFLGEMRQFMRNITYQQLSL